MAHSERLLYLYIQHDRAACARLGWQHQLCRVLHYDGLPGALLSDHVQQQQIYARHTCLHRGSHELLLLNALRYGANTLSLFDGALLDIIIVTSTDLTEPPENSAKAQLPLKKDPLSGDGLFVVNFPENTSSMSSTANLTHPKNCKPITLNCNQY